MASGEHSSLYGFLSFAVDSVAHRAKSKAQGAKTKEDQKVRGSEDQKEEPEESSITIRYYCGYWLLYPDFLYLIAYS
jgi:hypothetical protein